MPATTRTESQRAQPARQAPAAASKEGASATPRAYGIEVVDELALQNQPAALVPRAAPAAAATAPPPADAVVPPPPDALPDARAALASPGQPLDRATRAALEPRFDASFGGVRVHVGPDAARSAATLGARAYTSGQHIVFGASAYQPGTTDGQRLIAHELAHTIQQSRGPRTTGLPHLDTRAYARVRG